MLFETSLQSNRKMHGNPAKAEKTSAAGTAASAFKQKSGSKKPGIPVPHTLPPGKKSTVTGWPSQQKALQRQVPAGMRPASRTAGIVPPQRTSMGYQKMVPGQIATRQRSHIVTRQPARNSSSTAKAKNYRPGKRPHFISNTAQAAPYPVSPQLYDPVRKPLTSGYTIEQAVTRPVSGPPPKQAPYPNAYAPIQPGVSSAFTAGYKPSYVFDPAPDVPPEIQPGSHDNAIPTPGKTPGDFRDQQPCTCGQTGKGCTTLSHFAVGSAELTEPHLQQINILADTILKNEIRFITITGHTDSLGTDENNIVLGNERSVMVNRELRKVLHQHKPWSQTAIFWKTRTKGETEPVSDKDEGMNRRVTVCLK